MAAVAIGVGLRVANLALHLPDMDIVVPYFTALQILVTVRTFCRFLEMIAAFQILRRRCVQLFGLMAVDTNHVALDGVNVTLAPFAEVFIADPAAVTGRALIEQVGAGLEEVAVDKSLARRRRPADVAAAAAGVALTAVALKAHFDGLIFVLIRATLQNGFKGRQGHVQRIFGRGGDFFVALAAGAFRIAQGRARHQAFVCREFIRRVGIAGMACFAGNLAMIAFKKIHCHQNLFLRLQRNHRTASAGSGGQGRLLFFLS